VIDREWRVSIVMKIDGKKGEVKVSRMRKLLISACRSYCFRYFQYRYGWGFLRTKRLMSIDLIEY
jgi:hypothetical protein